MHEQVTMVERGALKFSIDGRERIVRAGESLVIPPHARHGVEALEDTTVIDIFAPPAKTGSAATTPISAAEPPWS